MKIIGLDVGEKRIGVARADLSTKIAVPVGYIEVDGTEWEKLKKLAFLNGTKFFVLGRPRSNEGNETKQTLFVMNFAKKLTEVIPDIKIRYQDESLTSVEAESRLKASKKPYEKGDIDAEAASIILQDFIETFSESAQTVNPKPTNLVEKQVFRAGGQRQNQRRLSLHTLRHINDFLLSVKRKGFAKAVKIFLVPAFVNTAVEKGVFFDRVGVRKERIVTNKETAVFYPSVFKNIFAVDKNFSAVSLKNTA